MNFQFDTYIKDLSSSFSSFEYKNELNNLLDLDQIDSEVRKVINIEDMRDSGTFFTGHELANNLLLNIKNTLSSESIILDPACGAGNLLIACSQYLPIKKTLSKTLECWGKTLWGFDIHKIFIDITKLRIILEALRRNAIKDCNLAEAINFLNNINTQDALDIEPNSISNITHLVINPPFNPCLSPNFDYWKKGKVNSASVFIDYYIRRLPPKCFLYSILPEVLRAGSRYSEWRSFVEDNISGNVKVIGKFNSKTNIDVFTLIGSNHGKHSKIKWFKPVATKKTIKDDYEVCVGSLVAYRDKNVGPIHPYIHAKNAPLWEIVKTFTEERNYAGKVYSPPFVVVRRTSSPACQYRISATIISGKKDVAVENHLIVIKPKDSTLKSCKKLLKYFKTDKMNSVINDRIRCRHLTVGILKDLPIP